GVATLARGWTTSLFPSMRRVAKEWHFTTGEGDLHIFADPEERIARGQRILLPGAFLELAREGKNLVVTQWDVESGVVQRFVFAAERGHDPLRLFPVAIEDISGAGLELTWTSNRLTSVRQRIEQRTLVLEYSADDHLDSLVLAGDRGERITLTRYEYDAAGHLLAAIDRRGLADRYEYDADSRLLRETLKDGAVYTYKYDAKGRCIYFSGQDRYNLKRLKYIDAARTTIVTDSYLQSTIYEYTAS